MKYLYETHLHTRESSLCAGASAVEQVHYYKQRGYTGIIVTDHFLNGNSTSPGYHNQEQDLDLTWEDHLDYLLAGYRAAKACGDKIGLDVFYGLEFTFKGGTDLLIYGLDESFMYANPWLNRLSLPELSALCRANNAYVAQAHPYRERSYITTPGPVDPQYLDGVEVYNATDPDASNSQAMAFAKAHGLPMQSGSDIHHVSQETLGGIFLNQRAESIHCIIEAIKTGAVELI